VAGDRTAGVSNEETGPRGLLDALELKRNVLRGFATGVVVTAVVFFLFVVAPGSTVRPGVYYVALAFVLAMAMGGLVTAVLMAYRAYRLSQEL
jgi:hypothetical protein